MLGGRKRQCEDCGRSYKWEALNKVQWTWRDPRDDFSQTTHLQLCMQCARKMSAAFEGDDTTSLTFHPI